MDKGLCLVTGATGAIGPELVRCLQAAGYRVRALARHCPTVGLFPQGTEFWTGDIGDREFVLRAVRGARTIFHLAAKLSATSPVADVQSEFWQVNVEGTRNVVESSTEAGAERLVYFSTIDVYGATAGFCADEATPPRPRGPYGETKLAAEEIVLSARNRILQQPVGVVLRLAAIYGPRMKGNYPRLVQALAHGRFLPVGDGNNRRTLVFEADAAHAALLAAEHPGASGRAYNVSDGSTYAFRDILRAICLALERHPPRLRLPVRPTRLVACFADGLAKLAGKPPKLLNLVDELVEDVAIRADRIQTQLGFQPRCGLDEGWQKTISAWRENLGIAPAHGNGPRE